MTPIEAINNVAKAYQDLAVVLMAVADKTIGVPVAQAMTVDADKPAEEPKKEAPKAAKAKAEKPAKGPEEVIIIEQVRAVLAEKSQPFNVSCISNQPPTMRPVASSMAR